MPEHRRELGDGLRIRQLPAVCPEQLDVLGVVGMNVQGKLELCLRQALGEGDELPEFMRLDTVNFATACHRAKGAAPTGDGGKAKRISAGRENGPIFQD